MEVCDICEKYICPPSCPSYKGDSAEFGKAVAICRKCGRYIYADDDYFRDKTGRTCSDCAEKAMGEGLFFIPFIKINL